MVQIDMDKVLQFCKEHEREFLEELQALVRIPSVSFEGFDAAFVEQSATATAAWMQRCGLQNVTLLRMPNTHPYVYGEWIDDPNAPCVLLYAHHDVQPAGDLTKWESPPFEPSIRNGRLYGRGSADDKAGIGVHLCSIAAWLKTHGRLPLNVKVIIEGEEEIGSANLGAFVAQYHEKLRSDVMLLCDTANLDVGVPAITTALRGLVVVDVEVQAHRHALHSGMWGGPIPDAAMALAKMLAALVDAQGQISIENIYEGMHPLSQQQIDALQRLPVSKASFREQAGLLPGVDLLGPKSHFEMNWHQPALAVCALEASSRKDARNILVDHAWARVGLRLVPGMDPEKVAEKLESALRQAAPWGVHVRLHRDTANGAWKTSSTHPAFDACREALAKGYGKEAVEVGCGGSIPFVEPLCKAFGDVPALLVGVEDPYTYAHGDNESLNLSDWYKAIHASAYLYEALSRVLKV